MAGGAALTRPTVYSVGPVSVSATGHIRKKRLKQKSNLWLQPSLHLTLRVKKVT